LGIVIKGTAPKLSKQKVKFRSYNNFDPESFNRDLGTLPFKVAYTFDDVDDVYWAHEYLILEVIKDQLPIKEKNSKN